MSGSRRTPRGDVGDQVLIVGAGPTGLVLALWLVRLGIKVRIVDKAAEPGTTSRALAVQARTLEFYRQIGLADAILARGREVEAANLWVAGRHVARAVFGDMGAGTSPYPYAFIFPQDEHERLLIDQLTAAGTSVEREMEFVGFEECGDDRVVARLQHGSGQTELCEAAFVAGCDGAHSTVRETISIDFAGGTYDHLFYVADVDAHGPVMNGDIHVALDRTDFLAVFPLKDARRARLVGTVQDEATMRGRENLTWDDVSRRVIEWLRVDVDRVHWFSTYRVHHRVASRFRHGRIFLLGDAAHVHSPVGGQGMNTGIGDAVNLAWKLAAVLQRRADDRILETYEPERIAFARRLVATTDQAFTGVTSSSTIARVMRLRVVPWVLPTLLAFKAVRHLAFRTVSQTAVNYRGSALSRGHAGAVHGGDRLPWVQFEGPNDGADNFAPLTSLTWQVHIYGRAMPEIRVVCADQHLALHEFSWQSAMTRAGLERDALYLVRPDGYVALAATEQSTSELRAYLEAHGICGLSRNEVPGSP